MPRPHAVLAVINLKQLPESAMGRSPAACPLSASCLLRTGTAEGYDDSTVAKSIIVSVAANFVPRRAAVTDLLPHLQRSLMVILPFLQLRSKMFLERLYPAGTPRTFPNGTLGGSRVIFQRRLQDARALIVHSVLGGVLCARPTFHGSPWSNRYCI
jgi:hypothetical protein